MAGGLVQEWSSGVGKIERATSVGGHVALSVGVSEGMVRIGGKISERLCKVMGGGPGIAVTFWLYKKISYYVRAPPCQSVAKNQFDVFAAAAHAGSDGGGILVASDFGVAGASCVGFMDVSAVGPAIVFILVFLGCACACACAVIGA
jgi:hypothetical protein